MTSLWSKLSTQALSLASGLSINSCPYNVEPLRGSLSPAAEIVFAPGTGHPAVARWSSYKAPTAATVVVAKTEADVAATLKYVSDHHPIPGGFFLQNGGHAWSTNLATVSDGFFLSLGSLANISVSADRRTLTAGAGALTDDVIKAAYQAGKQLPTTSCYCPSHIGATLGGGVGRFQGLYGMLSDNLVSARVALSTGEIVTASEDENPDLLWGLRGAGAGLGAVVEATYGLHERLTPDGKIFNLDLLYTRDQIREVFKIANAQDLDAASSVALVYSWLPSANDVVFLVNFVHIGSAAAGRKAAAKYLALNPTVLEEERYEYDVFAKNVAQKAVVEMCKPARHSMFTAGVLGYDLDTQETLFDEMQTVFKEHEDVRTSYVLFETYSYNKVREIPKQATAFAQREIRHHVLVVGGNQKPETDAIVEKWGGSVRDLARRHSEWKHGEGHVTLNFARGDESVAEKYGEDWRVERLRKLKEKWDPKGLFGVAHPFVDTPAAGADQTGAAAETGAAETGKPRADEL